MAEASGACTPDQVPAWSGLFWEDDDFGYMSVHIADTRLHQPPNGGGWRFIRTYFDTGDDAHVFEYRRVCVSGPFAAPCLSLVDG